MKTAFITGVAGFIGRHFEQYLNESGDWRVTGVDVAHSSDCDALEWFTDDRVAQYDLVIHAAAAGPNRLAIDSQPLNFPYNVQLDSAMFHWAHRTRQPRVIYFSSCAVYPKVLTSEFMRKGLIEDYVGYDRFYLSGAFPYGVDPTPYDRYGWTKLIGEHMARAVNEAGGTIVTVVRPFSGYGTFQSENFPFSAFINRALRREDPFTIWGDGQQVRDWIHVDDIVKASLALAEDKVQEPVNLCTGVGTSMRQLADMIFEEIGGDYKPLVAHINDSTQGASFRVGNTARLIRHYDPQISLRAGIVRALKGK